MMELSEAAGVIEANTRAIVEDGLRLVVELVITFEDVLALTLGDALARISDADLDLTIGGIERDVDAPTTGRELQGVGEEVRHDLLEFVAIGPCL